MKIMPQDAKAEEEMRRLDRELEAAFPASDALTITRPGTRKSAKKSLW
jgi:hypothetical protein